MLFFEWIFIFLTGAYHFGARYLVEIEVVMPADMTVRESHDIALGLQQKLELIEEVCVCTYEFDCPYALRDVYV
jgi:divalent metal cation (Fe/Co/Zn/Cd) transporter